MTLKELIGKKIESVDPLCNTGDELFLSIRIEGIAEPVQVEIPSALFTDLHEVDFICGK